MEGAEDRLEPEVQIADAVRPTRNNDRSSQMLDEVDDRFAAMPEQASLPQHVRNLIDEMLRGTLPYDRPLRQNEVEKFSPKHITCCFLRIAGFRGNEIAQMLGWTKWTAYFTLNHPYGMRLIRELMAVNGPRVFDIRTKLEVHAMELLDRTHMLAMESEDLEEVSKVTFGLLDRAGYSTKHIAEGTLNVNVNAPTRQEGTLSRLASAMEESNRVATEVMPNWTPSKPPETGGRSVGTPDEFAQSGDGKDAPPSTGLQSQES